MPTQKYLPIFLPSHDRNGAAQSVSIPASASGRGRPMCTLAAEWQIESQNREPRRSKSVGHLYQKFRLAIRASAMRKYNRPSTRPRRLV
jgi:hypothetical protein